LGLNSAARTALSIPVAILLVVPVFAQSPEEAPWHVEKTAYYELYTKSTEEITGARRDLDFAVEKFQQYFGEAPPLIAVVLFDSPAAVQKYDFSAFVKRRVVFLPWVTASGMETAINAQIQVFPDIGIFLVNASGTPGTLIAATLPSGTVHDLAKNDVIVAVNHQPCNSLGDFQKLYGAVATGEKVELDIRRNGQAIIITFAKPAYDATSQQSTTSAPANTGMTRALSHEAGHKYLQAWLRSRADAGAGTNNASPPTDVSIPEWFDEAVATLFEAPELQNGRAAFLSKHTEQLIPLAQLLAMANPAKASASDFPRQSPGAGTMQAGIVVKTSVDSASSEQGQLFYAETLSFGQFVSAKFGPTAIRELAIGVTSGRTVEQVLGAPNHSPITLSELEAMWRHSIRK
jgi:hypothetical protein